MDDAVLKVIDFGLGKLNSQDAENSSNILMHTRVGTPYYIAPEVLRRDYTSKCDVWSVGVIAYILLCGYPPFYGDNDRDIFRRVSAGKFQFPSPEWDHISRPAKDFVAALLRVDIDRRPSAREALEHHWLEIHALASPVAAARTATLDAIPESGGSQPIKSKPRAATDKEKLAAVARRMRRFVRMTKLKRLALNVLSRELTGSELEHLHSVFRKIDKDGDGHITTTELHDALHDHLGFSDQSNPQDDEHLSMIHQLMQAIDLSGDQKIDYPEFLAATMQRTAYLKEENMKKVFAQLDLDKTGFVTFQNLIDITGSKKHAADLLEEADVNNDRKISYQEFKDIMTSKH
uniref:Calmodulin n=2 Tax=Aureoumbra lagunensis TaxID=44058 RepID=A0A7S3JUW6_9STRA